MSERQLIVSQALAEAQDKLYAMIYVLMAGSFDTMDVLQETNAAILKHADKYDESRPALPWFKAFAMNQVLYYRRVRRDEKLLFDTEMINDLAAILDEYENPAEEGEPDYVDLLEKCLEKLPPWQRDLLKERYQDGEKVNKMAAKRLMTRVSLSVLMFRIRKVLQACIEKSVKTIQSIMPDKNIEKNFISELEAVLDGTASASEKSELFARMQKDDDLKRLYVVHARLHAVMHCRNNRLFAEQPVLSGEVTKESSVTVFPKWHYSMAVAVVVLLALGVIWINSMDGLHFFNNKNVIQVMACEMDEDEWLNHITPLELQAYEENMGFHEFHEPEPEMIKYEPGIIANPGAGIEILAVKGAEIRGRHLVKGDKVWREHLKLPSESSMKFKLETGATITLIGPATLDIKDQSTVSLQSGAIMVACDDYSLTLQLPDAKVQNHNAVFCANLSERGMCDVLTLSGLVKMIHSEDNTACYLQQGDGMRLADQDAPIRFRCMESNQETEEKFLSGKSRIVMRKGRL